MIAIFRGARRCCGVLGRAMPSECAKGRARRPPGLRYGSEHGQALVRKFHLFGNVPRSKPATLSVREEACSLLNRRCIHDQSLSVPEAAFHVDKLGSRQSGHLNKVPVYYASVASLVCRSRIAGLITAWEGLAG
jgi:hypothetical protein